LSRERSECAAQSCRLGDLGDRKSPLGGDTSLSSRDGRQRVRRHNWVFLATTPSWPSVALQALLRCPNDLASTAFSPWNTHAGHVGLTWRVRRQCDRAAIVGRLESGSWETPNSDKRPSSRPIRSPRVLARRPPARHPRLHSRASTGQAATRAASRQSSRPRNPAGGSGWSARPLPIASPGVR
jgi:hypothetical protein